MRYNTICQYGPEKIKNAIYPWKKDIELLAIE